MSAGIGGRWAVITGLALAAALTVYVSARALASRRERDLTPAAPAMDWASDPPFHLSSRYFEFHYQRESWDAAGFARFADAFVELVDRDFVRVEFDYPIRVHVLPDRPSFQEHIRKAFGVRDPPGFGIYFPQARLFATYETSGLGTFTHEIMHPLVERNLGDRPTWASEAIPGFFEKFVGYWDRDQLVVQWGFQNPWRLEAIGEDLLGLDLAEIVADERRVTKRRDSDRRLVTVFLWQQGRLERFLGLIAARDRAGFGTYFEAAMQRPLVDIVPLWRTYLAEIAAHRAEAMRVPGSVIFPDRAAFEKAIAQNRPWLQLQSQPGRDARLPPL